MTNLIYVLIESETKTLLYIGKTSDIQQSHRFGVHKRKFLNSYSCNVIMEILEISENWEKDEKYWINLIKQENGCFILNVLSGGNQFPNSVTSLGGKAGKGKAKHGSFRKILSEEHKRKLSKSAIGKQSGMLGKRHDEETKAKISKSLKGRSQPNVSKSLKGKASKFKNEKRPEISEYRAEVKVIMISENCSFSEACKIRRSRSS